MIKGLIIPLSLSSFLTDLVMVTIQMSLHASLSSFLAFPCPLLLDKTVLIM